MNRLFYALAAVAILTSGAVIVGTSAGLPDTVASHFGARGNANGYMSRERYELLMLSLAMGIPFSIAVLMAALPRAVPPLVNVPNVRVWLSSPRRDEALSVLGIHGAIAAILVTACIAGAHLVVLRANEVAPPHLDPAALGAVMGVFGIAMAVWAISLVLRFRADPR
jgi:hypothetical protein